MPENVPLYKDLTVKEFINYMADLKNIKKKEKNEQIPLILKKLDLENVQKKLIKSLSRGYKQRVSLAGALIGNPEILILDEPTVGLDPKQIAEIRTFIKDLSNDHTIIISSHILSEISQLCEKVIIINKGKIIAIDSPENLEEKVSNSNSIIVTVEDTKDKIKKIVNQINEITELKLIKENNDNTKQYMITSKDNFDIRKIIFDKFAKEDITIFELKKSEATLEDAFIKLIDTKKGGNK